MPPKFKKSDTTARNKENNDQSDERRNHKSQKVYKE